MNNVIIIAYHFPPEGNAGTYRPLRFVRQLPHLGWIPTVISAMPSQYERYDPALLRMVPNEIEVIRIKAYDLWQAFQAWRSRRIQRHSSSAQQDVIGNLQNGQQSSFRKWLKEIAHTTEACWYHPDMAMPWIDAAVEATVRLCQRSPIDVIWATAGPVSSFLVAQRSSVRTGIPYVLDFRDPWTITCTDFEARRPMWARRLDRRRMFVLLQGAQSVVFRHETEAECFWRVYPEALKSTSVHLIPNGYDGDIDNIYPSKGNKCTIVYSGTLISYQYESLLAALTVLKQKAAPQSNFLHLLFVGEGIESLLKERIRTLGLSDMVEMRGQVGQDELVRLYRQAHAFLVLEIGRAHV